jgi:hypothetical protein
MRNGSVAIVPLFLGIMILFWVIAFMGGASDTLFQVNNVERIKHIQQKMLIPAAKYADELELAGESNITEKVDAYVETMMQRNLTHN